MITADEARKGVETVIEEEASKLIVLAEEAIKVAIAKKEFFAYIKYDNGAYPCVKRELEKYGYKVSVIEPGCGSSSLAKLKIAF